MYVPFTCLLLFVYSSSYYHSSYYSSSFVFFCFSFFVRVYVMYVPFTFFFVLCVCCGSVWSPGARPPGSPRRQRKASVPLDAQKLLKVGPDVDSHLRNVTREKQLNKWRRQRARTLPGSHFLGSLLKGALKRRWGICVYTHTHIIAVLWHYRTIVL